MMTVFFRTRKGLYSFFLESWLLFLRIKRKDTANNRNPMAMAASDGLISNTGAKLSPITAPIMRRIMGNTYNKKDSVIRDLASRPMTT